MTVTQDMCEWGPDCKRKTQCTVHAQWTEVDFVTYEACKLHGWELADALEQMMVDDSLPVDVWITFYGDD